MDNTDIPCYNYTYAQYRGRNTGRPTARWSEYKKSPKPDGEDNNYEITVPNKLFKLTCYLR